MTSFIMIIFLSTGQRLGTILSNGNLDALGGKTFTERRTLDDAGKLLGREDLKDVTKGTGQDRGGAGVESIVVTDVDEIHLQSERRMTISLRSGKDERERDREREGGGVAGDRNRPSVRTDRS